jgi:quercetin dioxygenase-like cupin family protein
MWQTVTRVLVLRCRARRGGPTPASAQDPAEPDAQRGVGLLRRVSEHSIAQLYGVPLDDLVGAPRTGDPRIHLRPIEHAGMTAVPLTRRPGGVQAFKMVLSGASRDSEPNLQVHEGYEWMYILNGSLRLILGDNDFVVGPGEAVEFDTHTPHWFASADGRSVEFISLFGHQGERMHVRARPKTS